MPNLQTMISQTKPLAIEDFSAFYEAIHGYAPFAWQQRLAAAACRGQWPSYLKLPTSSGKTAAIDIAVFALAFQACEANCPNGIRTAPRRIFFIVDRRIVVNEAYRQTHKMAEKLWHAANDQTENPANILLRVANWLRALANDPLAPPLDCFELRGGIYRDDAWVRSPLQPTVLTSTVDQVGSRMLFRGYGVSDRNLPIHAAMTACDSLVILDEAHCSRPFSQTVEAIQRYRGSDWAQHPIDLPFSLIQMTATPPSHLEDQTLFTLDEESDYQVDELLTRRHGCKKPVRLVDTPGAKGKALTDKLAKQLVEQAVKLAEAGCIKIAIVVNRVAVAKAAHQLLVEKKMDRSWLMIGRMRPCDRDSLTTTLQQRFGSGVASDDQAPQFVVATQCIEVGADLDFDGMVTQCASLDALRQRFGRLNRLGNTSICRGVIVAAEHDIPDISKLNDEKPYDPVYGNALARTWHWLNTIVDENQEIDFGIKALETLVQANPTDLDLAAPAPNAPVLMPAHLDMLCQTSPRPTPEPDVAMFLHGTDDTLAEVRVCWRADLEFRAMPHDDQGYDEHQQLWTDAVAACPPSSAELLSVPLHAFKRWIHGEDQPDSTSDVLGETEPETAKGNSTDVSENSRNRCLLVWQGIQPQRDNRGTRDSSDNHRSSFLVSKFRNLDRIHPNATIVIPAEFGGWNQFGHVPGAPKEPLSDPWQPSPDDLQHSIEEPPSKHTDQPLASIDVAEAAFAQSRARSILRAHNKLIPDPETKPLFETLLARLKASKTTDAGFSKESIIDEVRESLQELPTLDSDASKNLKSSPKLARLLDRDEVQKLERYPGGLAWTTRLHTERTGGMPPLPMASFDDDNTLLETRKLSLHQHLADVRAESQRLTNALRLGDLETSILSAAKLHDIGKVDPRFQAMLLGKPVGIAYMQRTLWAKSDQLGVRGHSELPAGFRHEMLSVDLLQHFEHEETCDVTLMSHLIASHHGFARPLAPIAVDETLPGFSLKPFGGDVVSHQQRANWTPAYQIDSGIAGQFWELNRRSGWWGLAFLESILRLADWSASAAPGHGNPSELDFVATKRDDNRSIPKRRTELLLTGIDGTRPLGFLAALGTFATLSRAFPEASLQFAWISQHGGWRPMLTSFDDLPIDRDIVLDAVLQQLTSEDEQHPSLRIPSLLAGCGNADERRKRYLQFAEAASICDRRDADWTSCSGSDAASAEAISQLQTSRRDYHSIAIRGLLDVTAASHLSRTLFEPWDYADPIAGVSLHLEPREDRRHAYQWHTPSGDPTRKSNGGMIGANRLALEAWPLFQSIPAGDRLRTIGFRGLRASNTYFTWPLWNAPIPIAVVQSLLSLRELHDENGHANLYAIGIAKVCRSQRILVGKTPNLTPATALAF
ncbi:helicase Cas3 [Rosistilla oblonga]|uniref:Helicase Cas3 n=2 Tax=Rosistilla oblonga TaxID=2527990 RepID=A0A518IMC0_9BACT|nr:helicase Cas3 [Rosistilla oblonga]